jgi:hypothetical protein
VGALVQRKHKAQYFGDGVTINRKVEKMVLAVGVATWMGPYPPNATWSIKSWSKGGITLCVCEGETVGPQGGGMTKVSMLMEVTQTGSIKVVWCHPLRLLQGHRAPKKHCMPTRCWLSRWVSWVSISSMDDFTD